MKTMNRKNRKERWRSLLLKVLPPLLTLVIRLVSRTVRWRFQISEETRRLIDSGKPLVLAFWHGQIFLVPGVFQRVFPKGSRIWTLISQHFDGEIIARTIMPFRSFSIRGSSTRGGREALHEMAQAIAEGRRVALTPDGPRGPRCRAQPGVILLSRMTGAPIVPLSLSASPSVRLKTWDRFLVPIPFARAAVVLGDPLSVPTAETARDLEDHTARFEQRLNLQTRRAEDYLKETSLSEWWYLLYNLALLLLTVPVLPFFLWKLLTTKKYRAGFLERLGFLRPALARLAPGERPIWVHAVSVGEVLATIPFIRRLQEICPGQPIVVSTITPTGQKVAREKLGSTHGVIYFPFDYAFSTRRLLDIVRPKLFIHTETEIWPNFLFLLGKQGIPSIIVNGRISARSCRQYGWFRFFFRQVLASVSAFGMQSKQDCHRVIRIGADPRRVFVTGNMKFDLPLGQEPNVASAAMRQELGFAEQGLVWVAGSTHPGEEEIILDAFDKLRTVFPGLRLLLAPRHPERCPEVTRMAVARHLSIETRTQRRERREGARETDVLLLDTMGELAQAYAAGDIVFVGGSLTPVGGHNLLEPIAHRKPVLYGRYMDNAADIARALKEVGGGIEVHDGDSLYHAARRLLSDPEQRLAIARAAYAILEEHRGATERNLELLRRFF